MDDAPPAHSSRPVPGAPSRRSVVMRVLAWTAATLVVVAVAVLAWRSSDAAATSSTTAEAPVAAIGSPAARVEQAWTAPLHGPGAAVEAGRVVLPADDGVSVVDPVTGEEAWHYTRSGARLCGATAVDDVVVVLFSTGGRCNEITALRAGTGDRLWYRTVGFRADASLSSTDRIVLASSPTGLTTVDPTGNNIRWHVPAPDGCRFTAADVGSTGVAALQVCADGAVQAVLFDGFEGTELWRQALGTTEARLVGVDRLVDVVVGDELRVLSPTDGSTVQVQPLPPVADPDTEPLQQAGIDTTALVWVRGAVYALDAPTGAVRWSVPALGLPSVGTDQETPGTVLVPEDGALVSRDLATGAEVSRSVVEGDLPDGGRVSVLGPTVVVTGVDGIAAFG